MCLVKGLIGQIVLTFDHKPEFEKVEINFCKQNILPVTNMQCLSHKENIRTKLFCMSASLRVFT